MRRLTRELGYRRSCEGRQQLGSGVKGRSSRTALVRWTSCQWSLCGSMHGRGPCLCPCGILLTNVSLSINGRWVNDKSTIVAIAEVLLKGIAIGPGREARREVGVFLRCVVGV
jgi:hypothetical protein